MSLIDRIRDLFGGRRSAADYGTVAAGVAVGATTAEEHDVGADTGSDSGGGGFGGGDFGGGGGDAGGGGAAGP